MIKTPYLSLSFYLPLVMGYCFSNEHFNLLFQSYGPLLKQVWISLLIFLIMLDMEQNKKKFECDSKSASVKNKKNQVASIK